jgi:ABC-type glycerol-3-phosphate transport system permease component
LTKGYTYNTINPASFGEIMLSLYMAVTMLPTQVTSIGFYQFMYRIRLTNNFLPLILPAIAAPATVFFMW